MDNLCALFLEREKQTLSPYAFLTENTKGREVFDEPSAVRTEFQRDRDRIIHCQSFRRLMHKTQVFLSPVGDHYRTRLTHTLEVAQIARIISRALGLNEDLTEAIALGHDLGHTPFGHSGESAMQKLFSPEFTHYRQSLRVVEVLENEGRGLNLTYEVKNGIVNHTGKDMADTLEGVVVKFADRIAYINADIDDAIRAGILNYEEIPQDIRQVLGPSYSKRINTMVLSVVKASANQPRIAMEEEVQSATDKLRKFMFDHVYTNPIAKSEEGKVQNLLGELYYYYQKRPEELPDFFQTRLDAWGVDRCVCDYLAGMTDRFATDTYKDLFVPKVWEK